MFSHSLSKRRPCGFTLVELLVVIAVIGILVALLLPAVQAAREAARRMSCGNKMKQLALACHNYHNTYKQLPPNTYTGVFQNPSSRGYSWISKLLPFIEQQPLYDGIGIVRGGNSPSTPGGGASGMALRMNDQLNGQLVRQIKLPAVRCPSDVTPGLSPLIADGFGANGGSAPTSYKGVNGNNWQWGASPFIPPGISGDGLDQGDGIFDRYMILAASKAWDGKCNVTALRDITDGTANTLMIGESSNSMSLYTGCWLHFNHTTGTCAIPLNYRQSNGLVWPTSDWWNNYSFHSYHPGGGQFGIADGSVRFVADTIEPATYRGLASIQLGETVSFNH